MNTKTTFLLLIVVGLLIGAIALFERNRPSGSAARDQYLLIFDKSKVEGIDIVSNEDRVELRRRGAKWFMQSPSKDRANSAAVAEILAMCESLTKEPVDGCRNADKKQIKAFGLAKPAVSLKLIGRRMPTELLLGKETAVEGKLYARLEGSDSVWVVSSELRNVMTRKPDEFRDPTLADFDGSSVKKVAVKTPAGDVDLTRDAGKWSFVKPIRTRADNPTVVNFLNSVLQTKINAFLPENRGNLNTYGLSEPRGSVSFQLLGQSQPIVLEIGARDDKTGGVYGRFSSRGGICLLPKESENILKLLPNDLRDRSLIRLDSDVVDRIAITPAGKPPIKIIRTKEDWNVSSEGYETLPSIVPANKVKIMQMLSDLQGRKVVQFVTDVASDLGKYGLDRPRVRVTFSSYSSENTSESEAGEHPLLTLAFGKTEGKLVYARVESEPFIVAVDASVLDGLGLSWAAWRQLAVLRLRSTEIYSITVIPYAEGLAKAPLNIRADAGGNWATNERTFGIVNRDNTRRFLKSISNITAVQWTDEPGPLTPAFIVEFVTTAHKTHRLILGVTAEDGSCLASFQGKPGIFRLSAADNEVFHSRLIDPVTP
ncbi:MAG: DUF4340 domain-containing protein [Chthoniobacteraceae bacterium]